MTVIPQLPQDPLALLAAAPKKRVTDPLTLSRVKTTSSGTCLYDKVSAGGMGENKTAIRIKLVDEGVEAFDEPIVAMTDLPEASDETREGPPRVD